MHLIRLGKGQKWLFPLVLTVGVVASTLLGFLVLRLLDDEIEADFRVKASLYASDVAARLEAKAFAARDLVSFFYLAPDATTELHRELIASQSMFNATNVALTILVEYDPETANPNDYRRLAGVSFREALFNSQNQLEEAVPNEKFRYRVGVLWPPEMSFKPDQESKDVLNQILELFHTVSHTDVKQIIQLAHSSRETKIVFSDLSGLPQSETSKQLLIHTVTPIITPAGLRLALVQTVPVQSVLPAQASPVGHVVGGVQMYRKKSSDLPSKELLSVSFDASGSGALLPDGQYLYEQEVDIADQTWVMRVASSDKTVTYSVWPAILSTLFGLIVTALVSMGVLSETSKNRTVTELVSRRTAALKKAQQEQARQNNLLRQLNTDLEAVSRRAEAANMAKSEFLATMSHELRTPLNAILGFSQILKEETLGPIKDPRYVEYAKDIFKSGEHLLSVINDILDLAKLEAGQVKIEPSPVNCYNLMERIQSLHEHQAKEKSLQLITEISSDMPEWFMGDEVRLRQILINLVTNAIKFTEHGYVKVSFCRVSLEGEIAGWTFEVEDTGIGISENQKATLFDRFTQGDTRLSRKHGGVGLGLAICRELVTRMNGTISVESEIGVGTTIRVQLPLDDVDVDWDNENLI